MCCIHVDACLSSVLFDLCVCYESLVFREDPRIEQTSRDSSTFGDGTMDEKLLTAFRLFSGACKKHGIRALETECEKLMFVILSKPKTVNLRKQGCILLKAPCNAGFG